MPVNLQQQNSSMGAPMMQRNPSFPGMAPSYQQPGSQMAGQNMLPGSQVRMSCLLNESAIVERTIRAWSFPIDSGLEPSLLLVIAVALIVADGPKHVTG